MVIVFSGWWDTYPSEKYESQIGSSSQLNGKIKNVPNHQPVYIQLLYMNMLVNGKEQMFQTTNQLFVCIPEGNHHWCGQAQG